MGGAIAGDPEKLEGGAPPATGKQPTNNHLSCAVVSSAPAVHGLRGISAATTRVDALGHFPDKARKSLKRARAKLQAMGKKSRRAETSDANDGILGVWVLKFLLTPAPLPRLLPW